ncbi:MAG: disulfide bond formation protein B [Aquihabitans sp.]
MSTETVTLFLALLAVLAQVAVAAALVVGLGSRWSPALGRVRTRVEAEIGPQALAMAAVVALVCTAGSLYLSEVANFPPCRLCWFQRIAMYPQVVLLGLAAVRRDLGIRPYVIVLAALGSMVSMWHMVVERFPTLEGTSCDPLNPCSIIWIERFGYLTIPAMALSGFALIVALLAFAGPPPQENR